MLALEGLAEDKDQMQARLHKGQTLSRFPRESESAPALPYVRTTKLLPLIGNIIIEDKISICILSNQLGVGIQ
jgi:hypothetical protein